MSHPHRFNRMWLVCVVLAAGWTAAMFPLTRAWAQSEGNGDATAETADTDTATPREGTTAVANVESEEGINFFALLLQGGWFMIPIGLMSLLVVTVVIERALALRRNRILPAGLIHDLGKLGGSQGNFDPREAYRVCQRYPSAASNVVRSMLLKVGRPHSEVEHTVAEASEREADRLYANVRWLNLAAAVAPLFGLLGTVWGMIDAFHRTTQLLPGQNKADQLATGIYIALVTTFGGLMVAIPAAISAHYFEGRIQKLFHHIDEMLFNLLPQIERYEGRVRFSRHMGDSRQDTQDQRSAEESPAQMG
jgi:biopolymer transport protein ExbB